MTPLLKLSPNRHSNSISESDSADTTEETTSIFTTLNTETVRQKIDHHQTTISEIYKKMTTIGTAAKKCCALTAWETLKDLHLGLAFTNLEIYELIIPNLQGTSNDIEKISIQWSKSLRLKKSMMLDPIFYETGEVARWSFRFPFRRMVIETVSSYSLQEIAGMPFETFEPVWDKMGWASTKI